MKILIAYGSKYGAAKSCAEQIARKLKGEIQVVDLCSQPVVDVASYDKVIVGASVYAGNIQKEVKRFCEEYQGTLKNKKIGLFLSCMADQGAEKYFTDGFPEAIRSQAIAQVACGGVFHFKKMNFIEKFIIKRIVNSKAGKSMVATGEKVDGKKDITTISEDKINSFSKLMNEA